MLKPKTIRDWQLYTNMPDSAKAAKALTEALIEAKKFLKQQIINMRLDHGDFDDIEDLVSQAYHMYMYPVMDVYSHVGASDTEPREVAVSALEEYADIIIDIENF